MASLLHLFKKDPEGILKSATLRIRKDSYGLEALGDSAGKVPFDIVQNGEYGDLAKVKGAPNLCTWTRYQRVETAPLAGAEFAVTAPVDGCTIGALKSGIWFHAAANSTPEAIQKMLGVSLQAARQDSLNFIFGPEEYDSITKVHCGSKPESIQVIGMKMPDGKWSFWGQWNLLGANQDTLTRVYSQQIGRYPNA